MARVVAPGHTMDSRWPKRRSDASRGPPDHRPPIRPLGGTTPCVHACLLREELANRRNCRRRQALRAFTACQLPTRHRGSHSTTTAPGVTLPLIQVLLPRSRGLCGYRTDWINLRSACPTGPPGDARGWTPRDSERRLWTSACFRTYGSDSLPLTRPTASPERSRDWECSARHLTLFHPDPIIIHVHAIPASRGRMASGPGRSGLMRESLFCQNSTRPQACSHHRNASTKRTPTSVTGWPLELLQT